MVQFLSIIFFLGFLQFLLGFSKVPVFCVTLCFITLSSMVVEWKTAIWYVRHLYVLTLLLTIVVTVVTL